MKGEFTQKGKEALERFKMEAASEVGVNLKQGYNGDLTSREAGSVGGQMVKKICPEQQMGFTRFIFPKHEKFILTVSAGVIMDDTYSS